MPNRMKKLVCAANVESSVRFLKVLVGIFWMSLSVNVEGMVTKKTTGMHQFYWWSKWVSASAWKLLVRVCQC